MTLLEVCVETLAGARDAVARGAGRLELCADLSVGGLTPAPRLAAQVIAAVPVPVHLMVRPRPGGFVCTAEDLAAMRRSVGQAVRLGAHGVVFGMLDAEGAVDRARVRELAALARPLAVTFHRAFDEAADPRAALDALMRMGIDRVLTSGQAPTAWEGRALLRELVQRAGDRIVVLAGGGVRPDHVAELVAATGVTEVHASIPMH